MVKSPIKVIVRTRPTANFAYKNVQIDENNGYVGINIPKLAEQGYVNHQQENWGFNLDKVLQNASQEIVFDIGAKEILHSVLEGYSGTIMAYGQTGAGKTFTMTGSTTDYKYRGIVPRCITLLFQEIAQRYEQNINVGVSYLEIYNEQLTDLLAESLQPEVQNQLAIQEDNNGHIHVKGQMIKQCQNEEEAQQMIFEGETNRTIREHKLNKLSSRSHCIFTIHLEIRSRVESSEKVIISKLNLVDLAGSERTKKTGSEGQALLEAQFINKSLSFLEQVVVALSEKQRDHIPYRQCKLTNLLKDSIGGFCKTIMIANIWPEAEHLEETISTLKFATRMMKVQNEAVIQLKLDPQVLLKKYEKEIKELKQELAMHDTLSNRGRITYDAYTPEQQYQQQLTAKKFLDGEIDDIDIESLRQVKELFVQFKNLYRNLTKDIKNQALVDNIKEEQEIIKKKASEQGKQIEPVGQEQNQHGFGLGKARKDSKPQHDIENLVNIPKDEFKVLPEEEKVDDNQTKQKSPTVKDKEKKIINVDKNQAYNQFKENEGKGYNEQIIQDIANLKEKQKEVAEITVKANKYKQQIDELNAQKEKKEQNKNQEEKTHGIIDEEEYEIIKQLKELKKKYKDDVESIKKLKTDIQNIDRDIKSSKIQLLQKFEEWFFKKYGITINDINNPLINQQSDYAESEGKKEQIESDALAYIKAKKKVSQLQKARKQEKYKNG